MWWDGGVGSGSVAVGAPGAEAPLIAGSHATISEPPQVKVLAEKLRAYLP